MKPSLEFVDFSKLLLLTLVMSRLDHVKNEPVSSTTTSVQMTEISFFYSAFNKHQLTRPVTRQLHVTLMKAEESAETCQVNKNLKNLRLR